MSSWVKQRKLTYGGGLVIVLIVLIAIPAWKIFYKVPNCFDGIQNGKEQNIDCGGSCVKLCQSEFLPPVVNWTRLEELAPGLYNVAAYIKNPNISGEAKSVPYKMQLYDSKGILITELNGMVTLPPRRNTIAFQSAVNVGARIPAKVLFEFTNSPQWLKTEDGLNSLIIVDKQYKEEGNSSLTVNFKNNGVLPLGRLSVYVVLYDRSGNAIGFSKTIIDGIEASGTAVAPFTWPIDRNGEVVSIEVLPVAE
ncbi:MAG: hypothetical protein WCW03_03030 [Candidatus Paceibacterota bacterium]|jgi:hypothetical protein